MATESSTKVTVLRSNPDTVMLCIGDMSSEGATYQQIDNPKIIAMIEAATGKIQMGETKSLSLKFVSN